MSAGLLCLYIIGMASKLKSGLTLIAGALVIIGFILQAALPGLLLATTRHEFFFVR